MRRLLALLLCLAAAPLAAQTDEMEVDVELVLMVDVSRSMSPAELELQRRGYAEALASDEVIAAIGRGFLGQVAIAYVEWAGDGAQRVIVPWRLLRGREDALGFAEALDGNFPLGMRRTSISGAIAAGRALIEGNGYQGLRRVIDISGDGPNNHGAAVTGARDAALAAGIVINGLPLMTQDGHYAQYNLDDLDAYYLACVVGGPGSFALPVYHWQDFAQAVKRKLVLELVDAGPDALAAQYRPAPAPGYDCLIGEKIWERNRRDFYLP
jgi:hypothetical protein